MHSFATRQHFDDVLGATTKWSRAAEGIDAAPHLQPGVAYSLGDSLTYLHDTAAALSTEHLIGRRRYHLVVAATRSAVAVEVAPAAGRTALAPYDDLTDRQPFAGSGTVVEVPQGGVLVVDTDEAARVLPDSAGQAVRLLVTVEGSTFPNK